MKQRINLWLSTLCAVVTLAACSGGGSELPPQQAQVGNLRTQTVLLPGHDSSTEVTFEVQDGYAIFQGDINLGKVDEDGFLLQDGLAEEGAVDTQAVLVDGSEDYRWPDGVIPYAISGDWGSNQEKMENILQQAMDHWETHTLIRFVPRTTQQAYLDIARTDGTCTGTIGYGYYDDNVLSIGKSCERIGSIIHELGHIVGLWHEHSRADRADHVEVREENIMAGFEHAFKIHLEDGRDVGPYDYGSIMHYPKDAYAKASDSCNGYSNVPPNPPQDLSKCTIVTLNPADLGKIGQKKGLSKLDVAAVNQMYTFDFRDALKNGDFGCGGAAVCKLADVNNDGLDDIIKFVRNSQTSAAQGDVYVAKNSGGKWDVPIKWHEYVCGQAAEICDTGDFNNDGKDDIVAFHHGAWGGLTEVQVALSNGSTGFGPRTTWTNGFCVRAQEKCMTGDFDGDDKDDIITFHNGAWNGSNTVFVYPSNGSSFYYPGKPWHSDFCASGQTCAVGDVNGDGKDDIISFLKGPDALGDNGDVYVALSNGSGFGTKQKVHKNICHGSPYNRCLVSDVNGDGKADLIAANSVGYHPGNPGDGSDVFVALSYGPTFGGSTKRHDLFMLSASDVVLSGRLNGGDKADLLTISPSSNRHKVLLSYIE